VFGRLYALNFQQQQPCNLEAFPEIRKKSSIDSLQNGSIIILYEKIDLILPNKLHGPMHYKIGVTCVYNAHVFYTLL